jgi:putative FmdB family regulatory protein
MQLQNISVAKTIQIHIIIVKRIKFHTMEVNYMPRYGYECRNCGNSFEENVSNYYENAICPKCKSKNVRIKFSNGVNSSSTNYPSSSCG